MAGDDSFKEKLNLLVLISSSAALILLYFSPARELFTWEMGGFVIGSIVVKEVYVYASTKMQNSFASWAEASPRGFANLIKVCSFVIIACWGWLVEIVKRQIEKDRAWELQGNDTQHPDYMKSAAYAAIPYFSIIGAHWWRNEAKIALRKQEPALLVNQTMDNHFLLSLSAIAAIIAAKVAIARYYYLTAHPSVPAHLGMMVAGGLFIILVEMLDECRPYIARLFFILRGVFIFLTTYMLFFLVFVHCQQELFGEEYVPRDIGRLVTVALMFLIVLGSYFNSAHWEQDDKIKELAARAAAVVPAAPRNRRRAIAQAA